MRTTARASSGAATRHRWDCAWPPHTPTPPHYISTTCCRRRLAAAAGVTSENTSVVTIVAAATHRVPPGNPPEAEGDTSTEATITALTGQFRQLPVNVAKVIKKNLFCRETRLVNSFCNNWPVMPAKAGY
jgi:hypothetical protein